MHWEHVPLFFLYPPPLTGNTSFSHENHLVGSADIYFSAPLREKRLYSAVTSSPLGILVRGILQITSPVS